MLQVEELQPNKIKPIEKIHSDTNYNILTVYQKMRLVCFKITDMKKLICSLILLSGVLVGTDSHAQFLNNIKSKIQNKLTNTNPTKHATAAKDSSSSNTISTKEVSVSGNRILFKDDFSNDRIGSMPKY